MGQGAAKGRGAANDDRASSPRLDFTDEDLTAYAAGSLSPGRRGEVEGFLACNPDVAAQVMAQMHRTGRAAVGSPPVRRPRRRIVVAAAAACAVSAGFGWQVAQSPAVSGWREVDGDAAPRYVLDAVESRQAAQARAIMISQADTPVMDVAEIRRTLKLQAPILPTGWRLIDAQVYPSNGGPALNVVVEAPSGRRMNLFAVRANTAVTADPVLARRGSDTVAYWEEGDCAFVLTGATTATELLRDAQMLARLT